MNSVQCAHCGQWFVAGTQGVPIHGCFPDGATMKTMVDGREFAKLVGENKRLEHTINMCYGFQYEQAKKITRLREALAELIDLYESVFREEEELPELDDYRAALQESGTEEDT